MTPSDISKKKIFLIKRDSLQYSTKFPSLEKLWKLFWIHCTISPLFSQTPVFHYFTISPLFSQKSCFFSINLQSLLYLVKNHVFHYFIISPLFSHKSCFLLCNLSFIQRLKWHKEQQLFVLLHHYYLKR